MTTFLMVDNLQLNTGNVVAVKAGKTILFHNENAGNYVQYILGTFEVKNPRLLPSGKYFFNVAYFDVSNAQILKAILKFITDNSNDLNKVNSIIAHYKPEIFQ